MSVGCDSSVPGSQSDSSWETLLRQTLALYAVLPRRLVSTYLLSAERLTKLLLLAHAQ